MTLTLKRNVLHCDATSDINELSFRVSINCRSVYRISLFSLSLSLSLFLSSLSLSQSLPIYLSVSLSFILFLSHSLFLSFFPLSLSTYPSDYRSFLGKINYVGLSECTPTEMRRAHAVLPLTAIQMEYSLQSRCSAV